MGPPLFTGVICFPRINVSSTQHFFETWFKLVGLMKLSCEARKYRLGLLIVRHDGSIAYKWPNHK